MRIRNRFNQRIKKTVFEKNAAMRVMLFVVGAFISAISFNLFYAPNNFVTGGLGGISIIINNFFEVNFSMIILVGNIIFIIISLIVLGFKESLLSIIGALSYTLFVYVTENIPQEINFYFDNKILYVLAAGIVGGFGESLVYKAGFNTGGSSILGLIIQKYTKKPLGKILRNISLVIILAGGFTFGYTAIMYSLIITVLSTYMIDKLLIGISDYKTFFILTKKEDEIKNYIINIIESGVTEFENRGAFSNKKGKMLMCVVPTEKYSLLKASIEEIDPNAFIVVNDCYEVYGGTRRKKLLFND